MGCLPQQEWWSATSSAMTPISPRSAGQSDETNTKNGGVNLQTKSKSGPCFFGISIAVRSILMVTIIIARKEPPSTLHDQPWTNDDQPISPLGCWCISSIQRLPMVSQRFPKFPNVSRGFPRFPLVAHGLPSQLPSSWKTSESSWRGRSLIHIWRPAAEIHRGTLNEVKMLPSWPLQPLQQKCVRLPRNR